MTTVERPLFILPPAPPAVWVPDGSVEGWLDGYLPHLSASGIRLLRVCPEAWRHRYILGEKERPGEALTLGSAVHDALAFTHSAKITSHEDKPVKEVVEYYNDHAWPQAVEKDGGVEEIRWDNKPNQVRQDGERVTSAYHTVVSPRIQPVKVEQKFEMQLDGVPVPIIGYIDVEEENNVVDLKSGKQVTRKPDANWRMQGTIYTLATGKPTHFHSVSRAKTPSIATPRESEEMVVTVQASRRELVERVIRDYAAQIEFYFDRYGPEEAWPYSGLFNDYRGGPACNYCGFRPTCGAWKHEREIV
jgi:hypothetical protein